MKLAPDKLHHWMKHVCVKDGTSGENDSSSDTFMLFIAEVQLFIGNTHLDGRIVCMLCYIPGFQQARCTPLYLYYSHLQFYFYFALTLNDKQPRIFNAFDLVIMEPI